MLLLRTSEVLKVVIVLVSIFSMSYRMLFSERTSKLLCLFYILAILVVARQLSVLPITVFCTVAELQTNYNSFRKHRRRMSLAQIARETFLMLMGKKNYKPTTEKVIKLETKKEFRRERQIRQKYFK